MKKVASPVSVSSRTASCHHGPLSPPPPEGGCSSFLSLSSSSGFCGAISAPFFHELLRLALEALEHLRKIHLGKLLRDPARNEERKSDLDLVVDLRAIRIDGLQPPEPLVHLEEVAVDEMPA